MTTEIVIYIIIAVLAALWYCKRKGIIPSKKKLQDQKPLLLPDGTLPIVIDTSIMLQKGERCHFSNSANRLIPKNKVVGYAGGNAGVSFRVAKGVTFRTGSTRGEQIRKNVLETQPGRFIVTNKRIIFTAVNGGFDKKIEKLTSVTPANDGLSLQFDSQNFLVELKDAARVYQIISHIVQNSESKQ